MRPRIVKLGVIGLIALLTCPRGYGEDQDLTRSELVSRGRASTGFLELGNGRTGSAFCVHPSGLFITSAYLIQRTPGDSEMRIILESGTRQQRVVKAKVIRIDYDADLALLRAEPEGGYRALPLGRADALEELLEVVVFGFPLIPGRAPDGTSPPITVNQGAIMSMKRLLDQPHRIQINNGVSLGNAGGPLLDTKGRVLGVVLGRVEPGGGPNVDLAIPVNVIERFLARPEVRLKASPSDVARFDGSVEFAAEVLSLIPTTSPFDLQLVVDGGGAGERRMPMVASDKGYVARFVPFPAPKGPATVEVAVTFADGKVEGRAIDGPIDVGGTPRDLSRLRSLRFGATPRAIADDGRLLPGSPVAPKELRLTVGGQAVRLDAARATRIDVSDNGPDGAVSCLVVASRGGEEVGRVALPLYREGVARPSFEALRDSRFIRPPRSTSPISYFRFESAPDEVIGAGRSDSYGKEDISFQPWPNTVQCQIGTFGNWTLALGAGQNRVLTAAEYLGARRHSNSEEAPGIEFRGNGRGCNTISGAFRIWEIETKGNIIVRLAVDFVQRCDEKNAPLVGMLRYNSTYH